ncbi:MAG: hypothetical protein J5482_02235 [Oscillospiraceae bacterium]|nr:hypothetical protein [Oscillospiraceae bacterium]
MKHMTKAWLEIEFDGLDWTDVDRVEIVVQQYRDGGARKTGVWKSDGSGDCLRGSGAYENSLLMPWTREETALFRPGGTVWIDARPVIRRDDTFGEIDVETETVEVLMSESLFRIDDFEECEI